MEGFSHRLSMAIARSGKKKGVVARAVGLTPRSLSRYLTQDRIPHEAILRALATELAVTVDYLTGASLESATLADSPGVGETVAGYIPDAVALTGLDADDRQTVLRLLEALRSGDGEIRRHLIGQLKIIEQALQARRNKPREERRDAS